MPWILKKKCIKVCPVHAVLRNKDKVKLDVETNIKSLQKKMKKHKNSDTKNSMLKGEVKQLESQKKIIKSTIRKLRHLKL